MASVKRIVNAGIRSARVGWKAVTTRTGRIPRVRRKASDCDGGKSTPSEYVIVEDLPDAVKECYLKVLVWLVHSGDRQIDERELCEIQVLMTQLRCGVEVRRTVRSCLEDPENLKAEEQIATIVELVQSGTPEEILALRCSLIKDAIRIRRATSEGRAHEQPELVQLAKLLDLDQEQVTFIEDCCAKDEDLLAGDISDSHISSTAKATAAQAAAVGVPVAAVYLSGSVTGLSASGIVSGLAALGLGGVLGLSAMVSGIGVAILVAGGVYKGMRWAFGGSERHRLSRRELMLQEVLRIHQRAIINLGEDMSCFGQRIAVLAKETQRNRDAIDQLFREVTLISRSAGALSRLGDRTRVFEQDLQEEAAGSPAK